MECVLKLQNFIKLTEEKTYRRYDENLNCKVNSVNPLINEIGHEKNSVYSICDNSSLGLNGLVEDKSMRDDGCHLSVDGVKILASNLRQRKPTFV